MKKDYLKIRFKEKEEKSEKRDKKKNYKEITMLYRTKTSNFALILV